MASDSNRTASGELACAFHVLWLDHFDPPIGTGKGCIWCQVQVESVMLTRKKLGQRVYSPVTPKKTP